MKMKIIFFSFLLFTQFLFAQKNAPVAGDAAQLIDLLKKDYNAINPELRDEQLSRDMTKVISVFKTYLEDGIKVDLAKKVNLKLEDSSKAAFRRLIGQDKIKINGIDKTDDDLYKLIQGLPQEHLDYNKAKINYNTAKNLNNLRNSSVLETLNSTLNDKKKTYFIAKFYSDLKDLECLRGAYHKSKNTYLKEIIKIFIGKYRIVKNNNTDFIAQVNYSSSIQKALPFLGGDLTFETIIDGLSRFLANRIKEELTTHAIQKIQDHLNNPSKESYLNELLVLLPNTTDYLKSFKASQVLNFTDDFKQYIEKDLNNLLTNAANLKTTPRFEQLIKANPDIGFAFEALELIPQISKIKEPLDYFEILENSENLQRWSKETDKTKHNIANSIKFSALIANSLLIIDEGKQKLVSLDFMSNYGAEKDFFLLYTGFLHQQNKKYFNVSFRTDNGSNPVKLQLDYLMEQLSPDKVEKSSNALLFIKKRLTSIATHTEKLQAEINSIKKASKSKEKVSATEVHNLINSLLDFSEEIATVTDSVIQQGETLKFFKTDIKEKDIEENTKPYFKTARSVNDIFLDLHNKKYTTAIISALEIPSNFTNREISMNKLASIQSMLETSDNLKLIKKLNTYKKIPASEDKKEKLKTLVTRLQFIIKKSNNVALNNLSNKIDKLYNTVITGESGNAFKIDLTSFNDELKKQYNVALKEYAKIDIDETFNTPIHAIIDKIATTREKKTELKNTLAEFIEAAFNSYIFDNDENLEEIKNTLLREFTVYLPELFSNVFRIKDDNVLRIIHFITDMALSENAEDVEIALNSFALPAGSSSLKEDTASYFSINSYPGLLFGGEFTETSVVSDAYHVGITAPVGIYAHLATTKKKHTWGLFVPLIDIGAPVRFRLDGNDTNETLPDFDFKDIFSPGLYISWGWPGSPFSVNAGVQYGPKLTGIEDREGNFTDAEFYRIGVGLVIDIPLFTLYNKGVK